MDLQEKTQPQQLDLSLISPVLHEQAREAFDLGDVCGLLISMDNTRCMAFVFNNIVVLKERGIFEPALVSAYMGTRNNLAYCPLSALNFIFSFADRDKLMAAGDPLPPGDEFTLYRGVAGKSPYRKPSGYSWTSDFERAVWFASRLPRLEDPAVYKTTVHRDEILFFSNERNEQDFIFRTRKYKRITVSKAVFPMQREVAK